MIRMNDYVKYLNVIGCFCALGCAIVLLGRKEYFAAMGWGIACMQSFIIIGYHFILIEKKK